MKHLRKNIFAFLFIFGVALIQTFTFATMLFDLAGRGKFEKVFIFSLFLIGFFSFGIWLWLKNKITIKKTLLLASLTLSFSISLIVFSLIPLRLPFYPVNESLQLSTDSSGVRVASIYRTFEKEPSSALSMDVVNFSNGWEKRSSSWAWDDESESRGIVQYQGSTLIRAPMGYQLIFLRGEAPAEVTIEVNGEVFEVMVPAVDGENERFSFETRLNTMVSASSIWRLIVRIYPIANFLTILITLFVSFAFVLGSEKSGFLKGMQVGLISVGFYLFWLALPYQNRFYEMGSRSWGAFLSVLVAFGGVPLLIWILMKKKPRWSWVYLGVIVLLGIGVRLYWIWMVDSVPVSDFRDFHLWALGIVNGREGMYIDRYPNFVRMLAVFYRWLPTVEAVEILNVIFSVGTLVSVYLILHWAGLEVAGLIGAYLFAIFASEFSMVTLVNTDIPSVFLLTLSVALLMLFLKRKQSWILFLAMGVFALATVVRGAVVIYAFVFVGALGFDFLRGREWKRLIVQTLVMGMVFVFVTKGMGALLERVSGEGVVIEEGYYMIWPLVNGVNVAELGRTNDADNAMVHSWDADEATKKGLQVVFERLTEDLIGFYGILGEKFDYMFADGTYMTLWAFVDQSLETFEIETGWSADNAEVQRIFAQVCQYSYVIVLLFVFLSAFRFGKEHLMVMLLPAIVVISSFAAYTFFEVQPRYQRPILPFLMVMAGMLFAERTEKERAAKMSENVRG